MGENGNRVLKVGTTIVEHTTLVTPNLKLKIRDRFPHSLLSPGQFRAKSCSSGGQGLHIVFVQIHDHTGPYFWVRIMIQVLYLKNPFG